MKSNFFIALLLGTFLLTVGCSKENDSFEEQGVQSKESETNVPLSNDDYDLLSDDDNDSLSNEASFMAKASTLDFNDIIAKAKADANAKGLKVKKVVYARGIQAYELQPSSEWAGKGPLADLYKASIDDVGDLHVDFSQTIGTHYQHLSTPAWEFPNGRVIAESASPIPGAGPRDIDWLNVVLQLPNEFGYKRILRIVTFKGKAPRRTNFRNFKRFGSGYETVYVFLK
ncbi:DUF3455 domain-containing protein [Aquimarina sp. U1-2]|uniref:DUF3455 domain-containing protein n=1 Tax=Aquimarina sp. U1-2 TaxID=2823141 RepID=UPI001AECCE91|nr:DUF3455 domain-containing protein [Aquimarina sp. U1-2]MBP2832105.1 DUF3455 domain-containing protein [Aquimarina sp. U1-2]